MVVVVVVVVVVLDVVPVKQVYYMYLPIGLMYFIYKNDS